MIRVVLDTNVLVSAFRTWRGNEAAALRLVRDGQAAICISDEIASEYDLVLRRPKFRFDREQLDELRDFLTSSALIVKPESASPASPDPTDTKFIACAIAARADFLVTGNRRHFPEPRYGTAAVVNARELLGHMGAA